jgi:hypothetical protein
MSLQPTKRSTFQQDWKLSKESQEMESRHKFFETNDQIKPQNICGSTSLFWVTKSSNRKNTKTLKVLNCFREFQFFCQNLFFNRQKGKYAICNNRRHFHIPHQFLILSQDSSTICKICNMQQSSTLPHNSSVTNSITRQQQHIQSWGHVGSCDWQRSLPLHWNVTCLTLSVLWVTAL